MKIYSIIFGLLIAASFAGSAFSCNMQGMKNHSVPCKMEHKAEIKQNSQNSEKIKPKNILKLKKIQNKKG